MMTRPARTSIRRINQMNAHGFARTLGHLFDNTPWVLERTFSLHPFASVDDLRDKIRQTIQHAAEPDKLGLIRTHPDLIARLTHSETPDSKAALAAAGLEHLSEEDLDAFQAYNDVYRETFHFPFIICLYDCPRGAISAAFARRLKHTREREIDVAIEELCKIAEHRLRESVSEE